MDVSEQNTPSGTHLLNTVASLTGLPESMIQKELKGIIHDSGCTPEDLTLEGLRQALIQYLETMQSEFESLDPQVSSRLDAPAAAE